MSLVTRIEAYGMAKFCEMLRTLRKKENLTQEELAKALGLSPSAIGMYERGQREPNLETLEAFADCFGVSISTLVRGFEEKPVGKAEAEQKMLELFRQIPEEKRPIVLSMIEAALSGLK
ncbi:MAG: helix-turn-helix transcriptional regulator [Clostridia bacterium]|nr:helix-turn-helix transcriptional regulator [Clostridia bacterium]